MRHVGHLQGLSFTPKMPPTFANCAAMARSSAPSARSGFRFWISRRRSLPVSDASAVKSLLPLRISSARPPRLRVEECVPVWFRLCGVGERAPLRTWRSIYSSAHHRCTRPSPGNKRPRCTGYIELWEKLGGAHWLSGSPSCWLSRALSFSPPGPAGGRGGSARKLSPSVPGCRSHLSPTPTTSPPPCCFKPLGSIRGSRGIGAPFAILLTTCTAPFLN